VNPPSGWLPVLTHIPGLIAVFTTRPGGFSSGAYASRNLGFYSGDEEEIVAENWRLTLADIGLEMKKLAMPKLVHGHAMTFAEAGEDAWVQTGRIKRYAPGGYDAIATLDPAFALAVTMADCQGILLADPSTGLLAAIHAGWRGTRDGIVKKTLSSLFSAGKAKPETLSMAMSPSLCPRHLALGPDVHLGMDKRFLVAVEKGIALDMSGWNREQALECGVTADHIQLPAACNHENPDRFFSYRRDGAASGRMAAIIGWRG